ncbi:MAG: L-threonylcarbamoyladenylate synthase [Rhodospirillales bacterium]
MNTAPALKSRPKSALGPGPRIFPADEDALQGAAGLIRGGGLAVFATETVYGLGANALRDDAVAKVFAAKGRPAFNPLIVHVTDTEAARALAVFDERAERLAAAFWPGPLTLVLPKRADAGVSDLVTAGLDSIAVRVPAHPAARRFLELCRRPVAAPSANRSGRLSPTDATHAAAEFPDLDLPVLDAGPCPGGMESTVIGLAGDGPPLLLRPGGLTREEAESVIGPLAVPDEDGNTPASPGRLQRHYAPVTPLRINAASVAADEAWLGFGPGEPPGAPVRAENLSPAGGTTEAAANLFRLLRALDACGAGAIAVAPVPETGLGSAVNDRLRRAAES